jgi:ribonuclease-3
LLSFVKLKPDDKEFYKALKKTLGFSPKNLLIYKRALTHKSAQKINVFGVSINNERLEFLGDSVIDTVIADYLFNRYPNENEGFLTNLRSKIVKRTHLDKLGKDLNLDILINSQSGNKFRNNHILGNALEALVGAIYLDLGFKYAKNLLYTHL